MPHFGLSWLLSPPFPKGWGYSILVFADNFQGMQMTFSTRVSVNVKQKPVYCVQRNILLTPKENGIHTETGNGYETQDQIFNLVIQAHQAIAWCFNFLIRFMKSSSPHCFSFQFSKFKKLTNYKEIIVDIRK